MLKCWCFFLLLHWLIQQLDANPGLKVRITQKGLDYGKEIGLKVLKQRIKDEKFPDWSGREKSGVGDVDYILSGVRINTIEFPDASVSLIPGSGIKLSTQHAYATFNANWSIRTWLFKDSGRGTVSISGVFITAVFTMSQDNTGHPSMSLDSCQMSIRGMDIKLNGTISWLYKFFIKYLEKPIHRSLHTHSCPNIRQGIQRIDAQLRALQVPTQIDAFAQIDYSLVNSPGIFQSYIDLDLKGAVYPFRNWSDLAFVPAPFTLPDKSNSMLYLGISEYFFKSASLAYYKAGAFNITTIEELSSYFNVTTKTFGNIIPEIAQYYVEAQPAMLNLMATAAPVVSLQPNAFSLEIHASMEVLVVQPNSTTQSIFTVNIIANTNASLTIFEQKLVGSLCLNRFQLFLADSSVGFFEVSLLENFLSYVLRNGVIPAANVILKKGFPLPNLDHITLLRPVIKINEGYLLISTDIDYNL
ncbi:BPI fold-containing family C protein [Pelodiscus sinensis]|uniref:Bactericidal permeability-increasing protein n=1 Tax=Pelodiscus sinensis TaxID=13735 RepID=K7FY68_PELSI|nr:BPI fold-containing family C protein [Pelodiscus sinensis]|eukprot:XP_006138037.1 BPI fold-containing family C protein [Pelodiscus sinensis]